MADRDPRTLRLSDTLRLIASGVILAAFAARFDIPVYGLAVAYLIGDAVWSLHLIGDAVWSLRRTATPAPTTEEADPRG